MKARLVVGALLLLVALGALAFRLPLLGRRPMHADEAVQAARSRDLWQLGRYVYDPNEFHGPTLQYTTLAGLWLTGPDGFAETTKATYRIVPLLFGVGLIVLLLPLVDALGRAATVCAGVLLAVSPAMVFYSRYYIHETLLVFFTLATMAAAWRYVRSGRLAWCLVAGICVGLMQATKETCVITYAAMAVALLPAALWSRLRREDVGNKSSPKPPWHWLLGLAAALFVAVLFFSSFFTNPRGPIDGVLTYLPWLGRAGGDSIHGHPWYYYLHVLAWWRSEDGPLWSEGLILVLAAVGFVAAAFPKATFSQNASAPFVRWLGLYTLTLTAAYSAIPYKTPWCLLQFLLGMILLAGVGAAALVRVVPTRPLKGLMAIILLAGVGQLGWQSYRTSYELAAEAKNPYVYRHTRAKFEQLARDVEDLAAAWSGRRDFSVQVVWHDEYYWPLPWYLRRHGPIPRRDHLPDGPPAAVIIGSAQCNAELAEKLGKTHQMPSFYEMRRNVFAVLWVRKDVWKAHLRRLGRLD